ncbi:MAG: hypothetical protein Kow0031_04270 [Anaerolineae bacterium]
MLFFVHRPGFGYNEGKPGPRKQGIMTQPAEIVIKPSPVVFLRWLIIIELVSVVISLLFTFGLDLPATYQNWPVSRYVSFSIMVSMVATGLQLAIIGGAFFVWYVNTYRINRERVTHLQATFFGSSELVRTQAIAAINVAQSGLGQRFNYGTLELVAVDGPTTFIKDIPNPHHFAAEIRALILPRQIDVTEQLSKAIPALIANGESQYLEFKSSFSWDYRRNSINRDLNKAVMKNVVGFMNTTGGVILMGVADDGEILGLEQEFQSLRKPDVDGFENGFNTTFSTMIGAEYRPYLKVDFEVIEGKTVCRLVVLPAPEPVYLHLKNSEEFYIRTGNSSQPLSISQAVKFIQTRFWAN